MKRRSKKKENGKKRGKRNDLLSPLQHIPCTLTSQKSVAVTVAVVIVVQCLIKHYFYSVNCVLRFRFPHESFQH